MHTTPDFNPNLEPATVIEGAEQIRFAQLLARRAMLRIQVTTGLKRSGRPIAIVIREAYPDLTPSRRLTDLLADVNSLVEMGPREFNRWYPADRVKATECFVCGTLSTDPDPDNTQHMREQYHGGHRCTDIDACQARCDAAAAADDATTPTTTPNP